MVVSLLVLGQDLAWVLTAFLVNCSTEVSSALAKPMSFNVSYYKSNLSSSSELFPLLRVLKTRDLLLRKASEEKCFRPCSPWFSAMHGEQVSGRHPIR